MSKGYYIYLDRRDVGKGDLWFVGWFNVTTNKMWDGNATMEHEGYMPVFSIPGNRVIFDDKKTAEDMERAKSPGLIMILFLLVVIAAVGLIIFAIVGIAGSI